MSEQLKPCPLLLRQCRNCSVRYKPDYVFGWGICPCCEFDENKYLNRILG